MSVIWTPEAVQDRLSIWDYIAIDSPSAAARMDILFDEATRHLEKYPQLGKEGVVHGTRELIVHPSYRLVYEIDSSMFGFWLCCIHPDIFLKFPYNLWRQRQYHH